MTIKWNPLEVENILAEVETELTMAEPHIRAAVDKLQAVRDIPHLPRYMRQPLAFLKERSEAILHSVHAYLARIRRDYPRGALEAARRTKAQSKLL